MKKRLFFILAILLLPIFVLAHNLIGSETVSAKSCNGVDTSIIECENTQSGIGQMLKLIINILSICVGILGAIGIAISGIQYLIAGSNEEQTRKAKRRLFEIVIGIIAYVLMYALLQWLIPGGADPDNIPNYEAPTNNSSSSSNSSNNNSSGSSNNTSNSGFTENTTYAKKFGLEKYSDAYNSFDYWLNVPENTTDKTPIVLFLHGDGEVNNSERLKNLKPVQTMFGEQVISVVPVGQRTSSNGGWVSKNVPESLNGFLSKISNNYGGKNKRKIYIIGISNGAIGTWNIVNKYPDLFTAAVPVSCGPYNGENPANFKHTKIYAISGNSGEQEARFDSEMQTFVNKIDAAGGSAQKITYKGASHSTITNTVEWNKVFSWLLSQ